MGENLRMGKLHASNTPETRDAICERIANGETLRDICRDEGAPTWTTVYSWMNAEPEFAERFAQARVMGHDAIAQEVLQIADTPQLGTTETTKEWGTEVKLADMIDHRKLRIDARLKLLAKWDPKRYGEKIAVGGADDLPPIKTEDASVAAQVARLLAAAEARKSRENNDKPEDDLTDLI